MLTELGDRAQQHRVSMNLSQADLAVQAGVSRRTIERFEAGSSVQLDTLLRVLRALQLLDNLNQLIPEDNTRPMQLVGSRTQMRRRSRKSHAASSKEGWTWGDKS